MNLREWLMSRQGGRRRTDLLLRVLGAADFRVGGQTPYEMTTTGEYTIEQRQAWLPTSQRSALGFGRASGTSSRLSSRRSRPQSACC
jgi:hypothetical protein